MRGRKSPRKSLLSGTAQQSAARQKPVTPRANSHEFREIRG